MPISIVQNIDCMEGMKAFPDKFWDLAVVDPPYGIKEDGRKNHTRSKLTISSDYSMNVKYDDKYPEQPYFDELFRVSKRQIIWGENYIKFNQKNLSSGRIVWDKVNGDNDFSDCEMAWTNLFTSVRQFEFKWHGMMQGKSLTEGRTNRGSKSHNEKRIHPNHKPIALYKWLLQNYAEPGNKILDTHLGSQSSRIAAYKLGFDFWGYELDEMYYKEGCERFNKAIAEPLFDNIKSEQIKIKL